MALFATAINYARKEWEWNISNPLIGRNLPEPDGRVRWIKHEEAAALIQAAQKQTRVPHLSDFIQLALNTGCRRGELLGLEWDRVDLDENRFYLEAIHTKTAKRRSIPLNQNARDALLGRARFRAENCPDSAWVFAHKDGRQISSLKKSFVSACKKAGITNFRIHDMRHTCAAWLVSAGVPLSEIRDLLGHATVQMTEKYAHLAPENVRKAVEKLDSLSRFSHGALESTKKEASVTALTS